MSRTVYTEIFRLRKMLDENEIPYVFNDTSCVGYKHYQIAYPNNEDTRIVSVIEGTGTYGNESNLLEIMGLLTAEEREEDSVRGYLTAEDVFDRILKHYKKTRKEVIENG